MAKTVNETLREEITALKESLSACRADLRTAERGWEEADTRAKEQAKESATLRSELHATEMRVAELQGYVKALADTEPPVMVPTLGSRHGEDLMHGSRMPDEFRQYDMERDRPLRWFNRGR